MKSLTEEKPPPTHHQILIADDDEEITRLLSETFKMMGYRVRAFTKSPEALAAFKSDPDKFDLVISDCAMPEMTGIEMSDKIHKVRPDMPIVMASGQDELALEELKALGIREFVKKPYSFGHIVSVVKNLLNDDAPT